MIIVGIMLCILSRTLSMLSIHLRTAAVNYVDHLRKFPLYTYCTGDDYDDYDNRNDNDHKLSATVLSFIIVVVGLLLGISI